MKAIFTILFILFWSVITLANAEENELEFNHKIERQHVNNQIIIKPYSVVGIIIDLIKLEDLKSYTEEVKITRLFKSKKSRVKKALSFSINGNEARMA